MVRSPQHPASPSPAIWRFPDFENSSTFIARTRSAVAWCVSEGTQPNAPGSSGLAGHGRAERAMDGARPSQGQGECGPLARHCRASSRTPGVLRRAGPRSGL